MLCGVRLNSYFFSNGQGTKTLKVAVWGMKGHSLVPLVQCKDGLTLRHSLTIQSTSTPTLETPFDFYFACYSMPVGVKISSSYFISSPGLHGAMRGLFSKAPDGLGGVFVPCHRNVLGWEEMLLTVVTCGFPWATFIIRFVSQRISQSRNKKWGVCWLAFHRKERLSKGKRPLRHTSREGKRASSGAPGLVSCTGHGSGTVTLYSKVELKAIEAVLHFVHSFERTFFLVEKTTVSWSYLVCQTSLERLTVLLKLCTPYLSLSLFQTLQRKENIYENPEKEFRLSHPGALPENSNNGLYHCKKN